MTAPPGPSSALQAEGISVRFGGLAALTGIDLTLARGERLGLIGPNGAGKTTLVNVLTGYQKPAAGRVLVDGVQVSGLHPHRVSARGVCRTFQAVRLFGDLTVRENVAVAAIAMGLGWSEAGERADGLLALVGCSAYAATLASRLPYGRERMVGIARALAARPAFLLLDEPAAGLNEAEAAELAGFIRLVPERYGCGVLLIEHNVPLVMSVCDRVQVLDAGRTIAVGAPGEILADPAVRAAYLGS